MTIKWSVPARFSRLNIISHIISASVPQSAFPPSNLLYCALSLYSLSLSHWCCNRYQLSHPTSTSARRDATQRKTHSSNRTDGVKVVGKPSSPQASGRWGVSCVHRSTGCPDSCSACLWGEKWDGTSQDSHMLQAVTHSTTVPWPPLLPQHPLCLFGRE